MTECPPPSCLRTENPRLSCLTVRHPNPVAARVEDAAAAPTRPNGPVSNDDAFIASAFICTHRFQHELLWSRAVSLSVQRQYYREGRPFAESALRSHVAALTGVIKAFITHGQ